MPKKIKIKPISAKSKVENDVKTRLRKLKELEIEGLISKEEASSPTAVTKAILITGVLEAKQ